MNVRQIALFALVIGCRQAAHRLNLRPREVEKVEKVEEDRAMVQGIAERFTGVPYLWGGKTRLGVDCSGLLQIAMHASGL